MSQVRKLADFLSTYGREGDSMLVHMTPNEVQALRLMSGLAGGNLTTNPDTGLPEAFDLKWLLPIAAIAAIALTGGAAAPGLAATGAGTGAATGAGLGAATAAPTVLTGGLTGGLGAAGTAGATAGTVAGTTAATVLLRLPQALRPVVSRQQPQQQPTPPARWGQSALVELKPPISPPVSAKE